MDAVTAAGEIGAGHDDGPVVRVAQGGDFFGVGRDEEVVELGAGAGGVVDPGEHGAAGDFAQNLAMQAGGGEARRDDAEGSRQIHWHSGLTLPDTTRIMGDGGTGRLYDLGAAPHTHQAV